MQISRVGEMTLVVYFDLAWRQPWSPAVNVYRPSEGYGAVWSVEAEVSCTLSTIQSEEMSVTDINVRENIWRRVGRQLSSRLQKTPQISFEQ